MKLNGYTIEEAQDFYLSQNFNAQMAIEARAAQQDLHVLEAAANRMYSEAKSEEEQDARLAAAKQEREELAAATANQPITEKTAKAVLRKIARANKPARAQIRKIVDNQNLFNPAVQEKHIAALTEEQGLRILGKI